MRRYYYYIRSSKLQTIAYSVTTPYRSASRRYTVLYKDVIPYCVQDMYSKDYIKHRLALISESLTFRLDLSDII